MSTKILIAGGSGFIGSHIVSELWKSEKHVLILSRRPGNARKRLLDIEVEYIKGDVRQPDSLPKALKGIETVINCVQFPNHPVENPARGYTYEKIDAQGTRNLVKAALESGTVKHFVYLSGAGVREGRPERWFRAKATAEKAIVESGIPYTIFRPSWVYGREDRSMNRIVKMAKTLPVVPVIGKGTNRMQPLFIMDLTKTVAAAVDNASAHNKIYDFGGPEVLTMNEVVQTVLRVLGSSKPIVHQPEWLMKLLSAPMSLFPNAPLSPGAVEFVTMDELVDNTEVNRDFSPKLTRLEDALGTYIK